jgi:hypothetical protein
MRTPTHIVKLAPLVALVGACVLWGCKPERSGVTSEAEEAAPQIATPGPAPATPAAPSINATQGSEAGAPDAPTFAVAGLAFSRPEGWVLSAPGPMRAAELSNPDMPTGAIVFTHFGERGAGAVADNLTRWARQVVNESGEPTLPQVTEVSADVDGVTRRITFARYEGTYLSGPPGQTPTPMPGTLFLGAIIEGGPQGPVYMRAHGPKDSMSAHVDSVLSMLTGERSE